MAMSFCPKCNGLLMPKKEGEKFFLVCKSCNFFQEVFNYSDLKSKNVLADNKKVGEGFVKGDNELATYDNICKKCGYGKAQIIDMGIFYSDEDNLILLKCGRCGNSERIGRKIV